MVENKIFNKNQREELFKNMVILVDSREKEISHIINFFTKNSIKYEFVTLESGDYSFYTSLDSYSYDFRKTAVIERKNSLDEIINNFKGEKRQIFKNEFLRLRKDCKCALLLENNTIDDILDEKYRSMMRRNSVIASFLTFKHRYNLDLIFCKKENAGFFIYRHFYYLLYVEMD